MGRGPKPAKGKAKPAVAHKSPKGDGAKLRDLEKRLAEALRDKAEALEQQTATSEILRVISQSQTDVQPVFEAIVHSAARLLNAHSGVLTRVVEDHLVLGAFTTTDASGEATVRANYPMPLSSDTPHAQTLRNRSPLNVVDTETDTRMSGEARKTARVRGYRSQLLVPMAHNDIPVGTISLTRRDPGGFRDEEATLLKTFADQAVIAIENVRLFKELETRNREVTEALERQTATSEILRIISGSAADILPVFDAILQSALSLCDAPFGVVLRLEDDLLHLAAFKGPAQYAEIMRKGYPHPLTRDRISGLAILESRTVQAAGLRSSEQFPHGRALAIAAGFDSTVFVPILREGHPIGAIGVGKADAFSDKHIALLQTFADQAVIAIENVRLFKELEARNRDLTATSEILRVISTSPTDVQPVFDTMVESAVRLCEARFGAVFLLDGGLVHLAAHHNFDEAQVAVLREQYPMPPNRGYVSGRAILTGAPAQVSDAFADEEFRRADDEFRRAGGVGAARTGFRGLLGVPMLRGGHAIGAIVIYRREPGEFVEEHVNLLKTFADQAVIAIENVRLFTELQTSNRELTTALDTQTATSDILRVISRSQTDVQPVFDAILSSAIRLMGAQAGVLTRITGDCLELAAFKSTDDRGAATIKAAFPLSLQSDGVHAKAVRDRAPVNIAEAQSDARLRGRTIAHAVGYQSLVAVPMILQDVAVGTISVTRREPGGFTDDEIALLQTFADQAVIAIENVRLFTELQGKNRALTEAHTQVTEALEQQTATSEILRIISSSPTDLQPVMDTVAENAARLCEAIDAQIFRLEGGLQVRVASYGSVPTPMGRAAAPNPRIVSGRAIFERRTIHVHDLAAELDEYPDAKPLQQATGQRTTLATPLLRQGVAIGVILIRRLEVRPFSEKQVRLLETFADQAVIAIENVRLFKELQEKNAALTEAHAQVTEALDQQTATAEILRVISRSPSNVQPVFDAIVESAKRLLFGHGASLTRVVGDQLHLEALTARDSVADEAARRDYPRPILGHGSGPSRAVRERAPAVVVDVETDPAIGPRTREQARLRGFRSAVSVPMLRDGEAIGAIAVTRAEPGPFTDEEIGLLQTFAGQAVIAIENVRLFKELEARTQALSRSVGELRALGEVGQAISSTLDLGTVLSTIVSRATQLSGTDAGVIYEYDEPREIFVPRATEHLEVEIVETMLATPVRKGEGATGRLAHVREPIQLADILAAPTESRVRGVLVRAGYRSLLAVPLVREGHLLGGLTIFRKIPGDFAPEVVDLLQTFATQSALAIQNARLFREIEIKSRQLEVASQHKSEFLANMSHELRTPLNAIIGFSEVLTDRMFGELNEKQDEYLKDIYASGTHLLSLINDILDLSKIEAGRMELELADFDLPTALDNALTLVRERAGRRSITLLTSVDEQLGEVRADERKIRQVVLNLLSNAIKFTPEGGRIEVAAMPKDGFVEVSVSDTGVGVAPEDQERVFEEFRQVGTAEKKAEGTGLGLTLCRKFIELHGGKIWVKSELGAGSTFTFTIPVHRGA
jgi:GAF domain-containing protein